MKKFRWIIEGFVFGVLMFFINDILMAHFLTEEGIQKETLGIAYLYWMFAGFVYGVLMQFIVRKNKKTEEDVEAENKEQ